MYFFYRYNGTFINYIDEIEKDKKLPNKYKETVIFFIISTYLKDYTRICYSGLIFDVYQKPDPELIDKFYMLFRYLQVKPENRFTIDSFGVLIP